MTDDPRNLAAHRVRVLKEVDRNGGEADPEAPVQVVGHKDRIGADPADDKLI